MSEQQYMYDGRPGCVMRHRSRATGTTIGIYKADQAGLDGSAGEWIARCEEHGTSYAFPNLRHARAHYATAPWCAECHPTGVPGVPAPPPLKPAGSPRASYVRISRNQAIVLNLKLYEQLGQPLGLWVVWDPDGKQLVITPAATGDLNEAAVYRVQQARRRDNTPYRTGTIYALAPLRQSGLAPGRYKPKVVGDQVILKARFKLAEPADDETEDSPPEPAQE